MGNIHYKCPKCSETSMVWDYGKHKPVCAKCGIPASDFIRDDSEYLEQQAEAS